MSKKWCRLKSLNILVNRVFVLGRVRGEQVMVVVSVPVANLNSRGKQEVTVMVVE